MFCPQCGTNVSSGQRFCRECGAEVGPDPDQEVRQAAQSTADHVRRASALPRCALSNQAMEKDTTMRTLLMVGGLLLLLPLAIPLAVGTLVAGLVAGVALVAMALKLAPVLALGLVLYWIVTRQRRTLRSGR
jgi:zinc-ribbon domain